METQIIAKLADELKLAEQDAMRVFYSSKTYRWLIDDEVGIAREGVDAIFCRILNELPFPENY
jgi:hypothetical protein